MILLNLNQKLLNQIFVNILMHLFQLQEIYAVAANNDTDVAFKNCAPILLMKQIFALQCLCTISLNIAIIIQIHQEVYGSLRDEVPAGNADLTNISQSFKYKAAL